MLDERSLDLIFRGARTHNGWLDTPVAKETLIQLFDLLKMGPTSANCSPARFVFLTTNQGKERLRPALSTGNTEKTMAAPVTVIIAHDNEFSERLNYLFPHGDAKPWFADIKEETAFRNGTLQGAYLIMAARAVGLDTGPMSGFDNAMVDAEFFSGTEIKSNFICSLGHGDPEKLFGRLPRFNFEDVCQIY